MRYAITGATGFLGGVLARQLLDAGHEVVALVRDPSRAGDLADAGAELVPGDLDDAPALDRLCERADGLFHVAGWYKVGSRTPEVGRQVNVEGTRNALEAARRNGVRRVAYTSTLATNSDTHGHAVDESYRFKGRYISVYEETKAAAHEIAVEYASDGLDVVILMPGVIYGPGDTSQVGAMLERTALGKRVVAPRGGGMCWAHVDDVARGHVLAMEKGASGAAYMLAGPQASLTTVLRKVADLAGTKRPLAVPFGMVRASAALNGALGRVVPLPADYAAESLRASVATYLGSPARAEQELGWSARDLDEGLRETVAAILRGTPTGQPGHATG
ncbi:MAG: NAD-dependent epimerase/dehydratase family protein [Nocardioidaceae bacterium]